MPRSTQSPVLFTFYKVSTLKYYFIVVVVSVDLITIVIAVTELYVTAAFISAKTK